MNGVDDPRFTATLDLIRRAGASEIQIRYSGKAEGAEDDVTPRERRLAEALEATRGALHQACLKIGSTDGFRDTFAAAGKALEPADDDPSPVFWMVAARIRFLDGQVGYEVQAALDPATAAVRLAKRIIGGSVCVHCKRGVSVSERWGEAPPDTGDCWYVFDPELETFRRSCEGEAKVGRNEPCLCGSGRKFKHCHGAPHS